MGRGPRYPLEVVLGVREREKEAAEEALAEAVLQLKEAEEEEKRRAQMVVALEARQEEFVTVIYEPEAGGGLAIATIDRRKAELRNLEKQVHQGELHHLEGKAEVQRVEGIVSEARAALVEKIQALKAIEKHRKKWKHKRDLEAKKKEEQLMQEVATAKWIERRREIKS